MMEAERAYGFSSRHKSSLLQSDRAGCFHCYAIFDPAEIGEWIEEQPYKDRPAGETAICPRCGIDAVLAGADVPLTPGFLKQMNEKWFEE